MAIGYGLVRTLARWVLEVFYRRIEIVGIEHLPESGPLIVAANHQNALVDPMLLLGLVPRRMVPVAKEPLFRHPVIGPFLRIVGALPVLRRQEGNADPSRNREMFAAASAHLGAGHAVLIFPEGTSQPEPTLMPLRTGAARMLLEAEAATGGTLGVALVPIGLVYHEPGTFRAGRALLSIGAPVATADCVALYATEPEGAAHRLTDRLSTALRRQIVEADDRETLRLLRALESIAHAGGSPDARDATARTAWMQGAMRAYRHFREHEPARVGGFRAAVERYLSDLERAGLSDRGLAQPYSAGDVVRYAFRAATSLLLTLPLAAWGMASHLLPYTLTALILRRIEPEPDEEATYKIIGSAVIYPLCWLVEGWLAWKLGRGPLLALFAVLLVPTGFFTIAWRDRLERVGRDARGFFRLLVERDLRRRLGGGEAVDPDDRTASRLDILVQPVRLVGDQPLQISVLDGRDHAAVPFQVGHDLDDPGLGRVGERLDEIRAAERVGDPGDTSLVRQDLLCPQRQRRRLLAGQRERLVPRGGEHGLDAAEHRRHRLVRHPDDVVGRLRRIERGAAGDAAEAEHRGLVRPRTVTLPDDRRPAPAAGPVLGDLLEEVAVRVEEERHLRGELVDRHPAAGQHGVAVGDPVG